MERKNNSKYCYDNGTLINLFGIRDLETLQKKDRDASTYRIAQLELMEKTFDDIFNPYTYLNLHKFLFQDIYPFAGEIRDEDIYKSNAPYEEGTTFFCHYAFIWEQLRLVLRKMKDLSRDSYFNSKEDLVKYLAYFYGELNIIHPFREGNGRTLRTYIKLVVDYLSSYLSLGGVKINYGKWDDEDREELLHASIICNKTGNTDRLEECLDMVVMVSNRVKGK